MNFDRQDFAAFETDMKRATQELCNKYKVKLKGMRISYSAVDFDMKLTFEKDEEEINAERIRFATECFYYGFVPDDYMRTFFYNDVEYELIGFQRNAKKYNCIVREIDTGITSKINDKFLHDIIARGNMNVKETPNHTTGNMDELNLLSAEELSLLKIKLGKSKRTEKDWARINEVLAGKEMFTYRPADLNGAIGCVKGIAAEAGFLTVFTNKEAVEKHLGELFRRRMIGQQVDIVSCTFEDVLRIADENQRSVIFDIAEETNKCYYIYDYAVRQMKAVILAEYL